MNTSTASLNSAKAYSIHSATDGIPNGPQVILVPGYEYELTAGSGGEPHIEETYLAGTSHE